MLQLQLMQKKRELMRRVDFDEAIDSIAGVVLTHLSGLATRCSNGLATRRKIDAVVYEFRKETAKAALAMADQQGRAAARSAGLTVECRAKWRAIRFNGI
jgi:hypothetical protein